MKKIWVVECQLSEGKEWIPVDLFKKREDARNHARFANEAQIKNATFRVSKYMRVEK